jgi:hypothetical protein
VAATAATQEFAQADARKQDVFRVSIIRDGNALDEHRVIGSLACRNRQDDLCLL